MLGSWKCNARRSSPQVEPQRAGMVIGGSQILIALGRAAQDGPVLGVAVAVADQCVQEEIAGEDGEGVELVRPGEAGWGSVPAEDQLDVGQCVPPRLLVPGVVLEVEEIVQQHRARLQLIMHRTDVVR